MATTGTTIFRMPGQHQDLRAEAPRMAMKGRGENKKLSCLRHVSWHMQKKHQNSTIQQFRICLKCCLLFQTVAHIVLLEMKFPGMYLINMMCWQLMWVAPTSQGYCCNGPRIHRAAVTCDTCLMFRTAKRFACSQKAVAGCCQRQIRPASKYVQHLQ